MVEVGDGCRCVGRVCAASVEQNWRLRESEYEAFILENERHLHRIDYVFFSPW